jgi:CRP/FNR family transcriptional regulator
MSPWRALAPVEVEGLRPQVETRPYRRHQLVFCQGAPPEGLYSVLSGNVLLEQLDKLGNRTAFRIATAGDILGHRSLFAEQRHAASARALKPCRICFFPQAALRQVLGSNRRLAYEMLKLVATDPGPIHAPLLRSPFVPTAARLAHVLVLLQQQYAPSHEAGAAYEVLLSKGNIAALIAARRETVSRLLQQFERAGLCFVRGARIMISNTKDLTAFAEATRARKPRAGG